MQPIQCSDSLSDIMVRTMREIVVIKNQMADNWQEFVDNDIYHILKGHDIYNKTMLHFQHVHKV